MTDSPSTPDLPTGLSAIERANLALTEFYALFPTEKDCVEELYKRLYENEALKCRYCGLSDLKRDYGERLCRCRSCYKKTWFTSGTFFDRVKITGYQLAIIWLMERGNILSSSKLHGILGISQSNALSILKKIATVLQAHLDQTSPSLHSSLFALVLRKRSSETPARSHPLAELDELAAEPSEDLTSEKPYPSEGELAAPAESGTSDSTVANQRVPDCRSQTANSTGTIGEKDEVSGGCLFNEQQTKVLAALSEIPVQFDVISDRSGISAGELSSLLMILELDGHVTRLAGDQYVRFIPKPTSRINRQSQAGADPPAPMAATIAAFVNFVHTHLHGISRKYLQNYLAAYWCHIDRIRWQCGSLLRACLNFHPITYHQIVNYVSPSMVKLSPCA